MQSKNMKDAGKLVKTDRMTMRWGEMDALGHMNNVSYFRYFEEVRIAWFESLKIEYKARVRYLGR
jgi:acyl-CoA thioester hydrolase